MMPRPKALILLKSVHHQNTERVVRVIGDLLQADVRAPENVRPSALGEYDLFGFASGIYYCRLHAALRSWVDGLGPQPQRRAAFICSTAGSPPLHRLAHWDMKRRLFKAGFDVVGEFNCAGYDTVGPLKFIGGLKRGHPNDADLARAAAFARSLQSQWLNESEAIAAFERGGTQPR